MDNTVSVSVVEVQPAVVLELVDGRVLRMTVGRKKVPVIKLFDAENHRVHLRPNLVGVAVTADHPDEIVKFAVAPSHVTPPVTALLRTIRKRLFEPALVSADVAQVDGCQEHLDPFFACFADDPIGVLKILLVRSREVPRSGERALTVAIHRSPKLMLDQVHDDRVESFATAVLEIELRF